MRRRTPKDNWDIYEVLILPLVLAVILVIIGGLIFALCYFTQDEAEDVKSYNAEAEIFNALPKSDRETFQRFCKEGLLDDDLLIEPKEMPISAKQMFKIAFPWFLLISFIICVVATFIDYWHEKDSDYHLADLPLGSVYGWILLTMILPIGWPFLLGSRIFMWCESRPGNQAEAAEIKRLAKEELTLEGNLQTTKFNDRAKRVYIEFRTMHFRDNKLQAEEELRNQIAKQKSDIADYGKRIADLQRKLGTTKAELQKLETTTPSREATRNEAQSEWEQILDMRGVAKITASKRKAKPSQRFLRVLIKVRVPYKNELYDFGDYEVTFFETCFKCHKVRSGIKLNHTNTRPVYPDRTYDFCFGSRRYDIEKYAQNGRIIEALTLIIDCFHSVNNGDEQYIPGCYRKVKTIERAKRRLKLQNFSQGGKKKCNYVSH